MQSEYERLKKQGYTEEEIKVQLDNISKINISSAPMGPGRDDRSVNISDSNGNDRRTSSIMMGYNNEEIQLGNGEFINKNELETAIRRALFVRGENEKVICKISGKVVSAEEVVSSVFEILKEKEQIILGGKSEKITNQDTAKFSIKGADSDKVYDKGVFMLGNDDLSLASGEYVKATELEKALKNYIVVKPNEKQVVLDKNDEIEKKTVNEEKKIVKMKQLKIKLWPLIVAGTILITSMGIKINDDHSKKAIQSVGITAEQIDEQSIYETEEEIAKRIQSQYKTGQKINVDDGVKYHSSSDWQYGGKDNSAKFGNEQRPGGTYTLEYFSIVYNGGTITAEYREGQNLSDVVDKVCRENNLNISDVDVKFHIGGPVSGWVSMNDLHSDKELSPHVIGEKITVENEYHAYQKNFDGFVNVETDDGIVRLNLLDENGNLISDGSIIKGSDGKEYRITDINQKYEAEIGLNKMLDNMGVSVEFGFHGIDKEAALLTAAAALGLTALTRKKEEEEREVTEQEYTELLSSYKDKWDKKSKFVRLVNKLKTKQPDWAKINVSLQKGNIVVDEISEMYSNGGAQR